MTNELDRQAHDLSLAWDAAQQGKQFQSGSPDFDQLFEQMATEYRSTALSSDTENAIWNQILAGSVESIGRGNPAVPAAPERSFKLARVLELAHRVAWILVAGLIGGFIAGVGSRLFMRVAGFLTIDQNRFRLTEAEARVGEMTLSGTLSLGFIGAALGVFALAFYVLIRERLPFSGWQRTAVFSWILLLVFGYVLMDPGNHDYHTFGPAWLNVVTFSSLYLIMGFSVVSVYEAGLRSEREHNWFARNQVLSLTRSIVSVALCSVGIVLLVPALFLGTASFLIPLIAVVSWAVGKLVREDWIAQLRMPMLVQHWGAWVIPGLVGFILTARGITGILMN